MPKVSVIIPIYNVEKYLERCLDSVINQTLKDIEIICVNDCSTDNSLEILKEYASKDKRIKLIDLPQNTGAGKARNIGIENAKGEYIGFIDSDDFVDLDFYEKLYKKAKETNTDIIKGSYKYFGSGFINKSINERILNDKNNFCSEYCSAIFKLCLIKDNKIKFPEFRDMEDPPFTFLCALKANGVKIVDGIYVNIEEREDSLTRSKLTETRLRDKLAGIEKIIDIANNSNITENCYAYVTSIWFGVLFLNFDSNDITLRLLIAKEVERLYRKILFRKTFCLVLKIYDEFLSNLLFCGKFQDLIYYDKLKQISKQKEKIEELEQSNILLENCYTDIVEKYAGKNLKEIIGENIYFISVVNNYDMYNRCIKKNPFVISPKNIKTIDFDNTLENIPISRRYNSFLDSYDYKKESWFVFCHCDWELMDDITLILSKLDKNFLYGPVGSRLEIIDNSCFNKLTGNCYERRKDGSGFRTISSTNKEKELSDTFDCQAFIVHSSLIQKTGLRFDENLLWDLYVEDFCIQAKEKFKIDSYTVNIKCCHWSGYHNLPKSYINSLLYMNKKYSQGQYAGTVSIIGGATVRVMSNKDYVFSQLRKRVKNINSKEFSIK